MGLAISVGQLAFARREGLAEEVEMLRKDLQAINRILGANGLPQHIEPEDLPEIIDRAPIGSMPYDWLHYLRHVVAYAMRPGKKLRPLGPGEGPAEDPVYDEVLFSCESHLICHSDCEGFYVPVDFAEPLYDELSDDDPAVITGGILGSSQGGLRELVLAAPLLGIPLVEGRLESKAARAICEESESAHPHSIARQAWLYLYEPLRQSVEHSTVALFG